MNKVILAPIFLLFINIGTGVFGQTVQKSTLSGFSNISSNDTVYITSGQIMSGENIGPRILHGYYPFQYSSLDLQELFNFKVSIYPNPFFDQLNVEFVELSDYKIEIYSINGQILRTNFFSGMFYSLDLNDLSRGVYFIVVYKNDIRVVNKRIIKR